MSLWTTAVYFFLSGLFLVALAIPLIKRKIKPNGWYGFRLPLTLKSPKIWYPANAYAGKGILVTGVIVMITAVLLPFIPGLTVDSFAVAITIILLLGLLVTFILSYRLARLIDRQIEA